MKLTKEDLKKKIDEKIADESLKIELLEDVEDSFEISDDSEKVSKEEYDKVVSERDEIRTKYKERFLGEVKEEKEEELPEEEKEEKIEIFETKEEE